jgi:hypothetical protein
MLAMLCRGVEPTVAVLAALAGGMAVTTAPQPARVTAAQNRAVRRWVRRGGHSGGGRRHGWVSFAVAGVAGVAVAGVAGVAVAGLAGVAVAGVRTGSGTGQPMKSIYVCANITGRIDTLPARAVVFGESGRRFAG